MIQNDVQQLAARLVSSSSVHFNNWIPLFNVDGGYPRYSLESSYNVPHPLYYASLLGLSQIVNELVLSSALANVNSIGGRYGSALGSASASGHKEVVQILLAKGADVNIAGVKDGNALGLASANGHQEVVQILLGNGIDVNMAGGYYGSALASASVNGRKEVVQVLLENGADVNMAAQYGSALALALALAGGYKEVVQILLEKGADVHSLGGGNPLRLASANGHLDVVRILLDHGANVSSNHEDVMKRAREESERFGQLLLDRPDDY